MAATVATPQCLSIYEVSSPQTKKVSESLQYATDDVYNSVCYIIYIHENHCLDNQFPSRG